MMYTWIIIAVLVVVGAWYISKNKNPFTGDEPEEAPLEILKKRYAQGEISQEEFEERKQLLEQDL